MSVTEILTDQSSAPEYRIGKHPFPYMRATGYIVMFAFLLRLVIAVSYLNAYDTEWNIMWGVQLRDDFFAAHSYVSSLDYPPLYLYPLYLVGRLISIESIGGYPPFRMLAIKSIPCNGRSVDILNRSTALFT